jgi:hypothetical protein
MKHLLGQIALVLALSTVISFATLLKASYDYSDTFKESLPAGVDASSIRIAVWGWPVPFIGDASSGRHWEKLDAGDIFDQARFSRNIIAWMILLGGSWWLGAALLRSAGRSAP